MTKQELIKEYEAGKLPVLSTLNESAFSGMSLVHINEVECKVFGYTYIYKSDCMQADYFYVKYRVTSKGLIRFTVSGYEYKLEEFVRSDL